MNFACYMGWGDLKEIDYNAGHDGSSPLLGSTVEAWKPKLGLKIVLKDEPKSAEGVQQALANIGYLADPVMNPEFNKPRTGKFFLILRLDCQSTKTRYTWDKNLTYLTVQVPAYAGVDQSEMREALKRAQ